MKEVEYAKTHLEALARHRREYMMELGEWEVCTQTPAQMVLPNQFLAVRLTLMHLEQDVIGQSILIESDNTATVSYINKQGGVVCKTLNDET